MSNITALSTWSFDGISFAVRAAGETWELWFEESTIQQIDPILDSDQRYVDTGGVQYGPLTKQAAFASVAQRTQFLGKRGRSGTLTNIQGQSRQALLSKVKALGSGDGYVWAELTWEAL